MGDFECTNCAGQNVRKMRVKTFEILNKEARDPNCHAPKLSPAVAILIQTTAVLSFALTYTNYTRILQYSSNFHRSCPRRMTTAKQQVSGLRRGILYAQNITEIVLEMRTTSPGKTNSGSVAGKA